MTTLEQISALVAQQQALLADYMPYQEKRERLASIVNRITQLYAEKRQEEADRHTTLADRGRR